MDRRAFLKGLGIILPAFYVPKKYFWFPGNPVGPKMLTFEEFLAIQVREDWKRIQNRIELDELFL